MSISSEIINMKNIRFLLFLGLALSSVPAQAQFKRSSDSNAYPYTVTLGSDYVFIIGRPGVTNYNYASSNLFTSVTNIAAYQAFLATNNLLGTITNIAAYQAYLATNNFLATVTNISAYQAFLATNNYASTVTNIAAYQAFLATNNYASTVSNIANYYITIATNNLAPTNTGIAGQVLTVSANGGATRWDYVNQTLTNSNPVVPDFNLPVNYWVTNAALLFLAPANVETTGKKLQVTDCIVTNSTAAAVAVTFPGSIHVTGTAFITNLSVFHFRQFAGKWTNCACEPVW